MARKRIALTVLMLFLFCGSALAGASPQSNLPILGMIQKAADVVASTSSTYSLINTTWYQFEKVLGISAILITEPDYMFAISNASTSPFSWIINSKDNVNYLLNFSRNPDQSVTGGALNGGGRAIGNGPIWTEIIGCGCGVGSNFDPYANPIWKVKYADGDVLELQNNNSAPESEPEDSTTLIFYKSTDWFVWEVDQIVTTTVTGMDGYDAGATISTFTNNPVFACLESTGTIVAGQCQITWLSDGISSLKEMQWTAMGDGDTTINDTIGWIPISSTTPLVEGNAGTEGAELKDVMVPEINGPNTAALTFNASQSSWDTSFVSVFYPFYNDAGANYTKLVTLAKELYAMNAESVNVAYQFGGSNMPNPLWCDPNVNNDVGYGKCNYGPGLSVSNGQIFLGTSDASYMDYYDGSESYFGIYNQTIFSPETQYGSSALTIYDPIAGCSPDRSIGLVNGTGKFCMGRIGDSGNTLSPLNNITDYEKNGGYWGTFNAGDPEIESNITVGIPSPSSDKFVIEFNVTAEASDEIQTLESGLRFPVSITTSYLRELNSTFYDYEFYDPVYNNWVGWVVGIYGYNNIENNVTFGSTAVQVYLAKYNSQNLVSPGTKYEAGLILWPHFGNITNVDQITPVDSGSNIVLSPKEMLYTSTPSNTASPVALESLQSATTLLYTNRTSTGWNATLLYPSGSFTQYFLWNATNGGRLTNVIGSAVNSWSQSEVGSTGIYNVTVSLTYHSAIQIAFQVSNSTVSFSLNLLCANSCPTSGIFTLLGGSVFPNSASWGSSHGYRAFSGQTITITAPSSSFIFNSTCSGDGTTCTFSAGNQTFTLTTHYVNSSTVQATSTFATTGSSITSTTTGSSITSTTTGSSSQSRSQIISQYGYEELEGTVVIGVLLSVAFIIWNRKLQR